MKVVIDTNGLDREGRPVEVEVGFKLIDDAESNTARRCLWFETSMETVTLDMEVPTVRRLIRALEFLVDAAE